MDPFDLALSIVLFVSALAGVACFVAIKRDHFRWPLIALVAIPITVLAIEVTAFPSSLEGVTSLTGVFTMMFSVIWVPYWLIMAILGIWLGARNST